MEYHLLNIVTSSEGDPKCVLLRSIEPFHGLAEMEIRRKIPAKNTKISSGPRSLTKALGIDLTFNKENLTKNRIWIEDHGINYDQSQISQVSRIGVGYAEEHASLPLRFYINDSKYVINKISKSILKQ